MAEELNMHFSSVFTREDTSSLPVPETKFNGSEGERLGQLVVTPEVVANKINNILLVPGVVYIRLESKLPSCRESYVYDWDFRGCPREPAAL